MKNSTDTSTLLLDVILKFSSKTNNTITDIQRKELTEYGISFGRSYDDCTHIVCNPEEYENIILKVRSPESLYFVTPKFVTDILTYGIRFQEDRYSSDPLHFFSGLKFVINCSNIDNYQDYKSLSYYYGADVVDTISQQITHIIIQKDNINSELLIEATEKTQGLILDIEWLDQCLRMKKMIDESPFTIDKGKNTNIIKEKKYYGSWSNNLRKTMYIICKNLSQFQQSLLSKYHLYFSPMIDPYKSLYLQELSSYHGAIISKTITHSTHIISYCDIYKSKTRISLHPNWLLISIENSEVVNIESDDKSSPNSPSSFEIALSRSTPQKYMKEFNQKMISVIGFSSSTYPRLCYIENAIHMLGGTVLYTISNYYTIPDYIVYNIDSDLLDLSEIENIPILTVDWIIRCLYEWKFVEQSPYLLSTKLDHLEALYTSQIDNENNEKMEEEEVEVENDSIYIGNMSYNTESEQSQQQQQQLLIPFSSPESQDNNFINDNIITQSDDISFQSNDVVVTHHKKHKKKDIEKEENKDIDVIQCEDERNREEIIMEENEYDVNNEINKSNNQNVVLINDEKEGIEERDKSKDSNKSISISSPDTSHVHQDYNPNTNNNIETKETKENVVENSVLNYSKANNKSTSSSTSEESSVIILPNIQNIVNEQEEKPIEKEKEKNKSDESTVSLENENKNEVNNSLVFDVSQSDNSIQYFNKQSSLSNQTEDSVSPPILPSPNKPKIYQPSIQTPSVIERKLELTQNDKIQSQEEENKNDNSMEIENENDDDNDKKSDSVVVVVVSSSEEQQSQLPQLLQPSIQTPLIIEKRLELTQSEEKNISFGTMEIENKEENEETDNKNDNNHSNSVVTSLPTEDIQSQSLPPQQQQPQLSSPNNIHFTIPSQLFETQSQSLQQQNNIESNSQSISQSDGYSHFIFRSNSTPIKPISLPIIEEKNDNTIMNEEEETKTSSTTTTRLKTKSKTLPTPKTKRKSKDLSLTPNKRIKKTPSSTTSSQKSIKQQLKQQFKNIYLLFSNSGCAEYKKKAKDLGLSVLDTKHDFSNETTHLITNEMKRTIKVVCALCSGIYILKPSFITELEMNYKKNRISSIEEMNMDEFEWNEEVKDINENCSKFWREEKNKTGQGAFYNKIFIISDNTIPPSDKLCEIIESGEGVAYIRKIKSSNKKCYENNSKNIENIKNILIVENDWKLLNKYPSELEEDVDVVLTASYILDYISRCKHVNITDYLL